MHHVKSSERANFSNIWGNLKLLLTRNIPLVPDQFECKLMIVMKLHSIITDQRSLPKFPSYYLELGLGITDRQSEIKVYEVLLFNHDYFNFWIIHSR